MVKGNETWGGKGNEGGMGQENMAARFPWDSADIISVTSHQERLIKMSRISATTIVVTSWYGIRGEGSAEDAPRIMEIASTLRLSCAPGIDIDICSGI